MYILMMHLLFLSAWCSFTNWRDYSEDTRKGNWSEIKIYTNLYLDEICKGKATPYICELKDTKEGRDKIHQYVINSLSNYTDFGIADALMEMERGLNPNMIND